jgi:signal transduction histidine kinase
MQSGLNFILIFFFYGLAFFSMGLLVMLEGGRASDPRLRKALRPLAAFGLLHGFNEWLEMYGIIAVSFGIQLPIWFSGVRLAILSFSFISLAAFGSYLIARNENVQKYILVIPIGMEAVWVFGILNLEGTYVGPQLWVVTDVWTRYSLAIPASLLAAAGLIVQQRAFRKAGMVSFGRDSLYAAIAFAWYGLIGQFFVPTSPLPPSAIINEGLFITLFGFPVQLFRAFSAGVASFFVIRFMRAFQVETDHKIAELQQMQLEDARQHEALRGELFRRVVAAQEAERQRIARDLHDETGQSLTAIGMGLRGLSTTIQVGNIDKAVTTLRHLESLNVNSLTELQRLISDLRPSHLDDLGLSAAIRWYAGSLQERTGIIIKVEVIGHEKQSSTAVKTAIFRIVQEALNNVTKHAKAMNVNIGLTYETANVRVRIKDDGQGFDVTAKKSQTGGRPSLGLVGMQERVNLLNGTFFVASVPGQGTLVEVTVPYQQEVMEVDDENTPAAGG